MTHGEAAPSDAAPDAAGAESVVPLFPLPGVTLFPSVRAPFYIFEPRYRAMLSDVLDGPGLIAVPMLASGAPAQPEGVPAIRRVFGVGEVVGYETHDDGTSHIELLGRERVTLVEEIPSTPYRRARVRAAPEPRPEPAEARAIAADLSAAVARLTPRLSAEAHEAISRVLARGAEDVPFLVNMLTVIVVGDPDVRQSLLEAPSLLDRGRHLATILDMLRQESDEAGRGRR